MSETTETLDPTTNPASVYFLHPSETSQKIMHDVFTGTSYTDWKRSVMIALSARNKLCFVNGTLPKPPTTNSTHKAWERVNSVVIGWLIGAVDHNIARSIQWFTTAHEIWKDLEERFGQSSFAQLFSLQEADKLSQTPDMSIADFYTKMKGVWDELDSLNPLPMCTCEGCSCNLTKQFYKLQQQQRLLNFLMKVDNKYSQVRTNILMMSELPSISQAYRLLVQEQRHQELSLISGEDTGDGVAFAVNRRAVFGKGQNRFVNHFQQQQPGNFGTDRGKQLGNSGTSQNRSVLGVKRPNTYFCTHCKMNGHSVERCWKIHGFPPGFKNNTWRRNISSNTSHAHMAQDPNNLGSLEAQDQGDLINAQLTSAQYQKLLELMEQGNSGNDMLGSQNIDHTTLLSGPFDERVLGDW